MQSIYYIVNCKALNYVKFCVYAVILCGTALS